MATLPIDPTRIDPEGIGEHQTTHQLDARELRIGGLFPCNVIIREEEPGVQTVYHVSTTKTAGLAGMAPDDAWADIVAESGDMVDAAWANL